MVERTRQLLSEISALLPSADEGGPNQWLFGAQDPTMLDANLIPLLVRLKDVGRTELIPENLRKYMERAEAMEEWKTMMQGRKTYQPPDKDRLPNYRKGEGKE
jgi:hypothetical protein